MPTYLVPPENRVWVVTGATMLKPPTTPNEVFGVNLQIGLLGPQTGQADYTPTITLTGNPDIGATFAVAVNPFIVGNATYSLWRPITWGTVQQLGWDEPDCGNT